MDMTRKIFAILEAMEEAYKRENVDGDFADALRYYLDDATDAEIEADYQKWCNKA